MEAQVPFMEELIRSMLKFEPVVRAQGLSPIVASFEFSLEKKLRQDLSDVEQQKRQLSERLTQYDERKLILRLKGDALADELCKWFEEHLGIRTERVEEYKEDFWILGDAEERVAICEAKGLEANVKRQHITQAELHRDERELPDDFPTLLMVNSFAGAETVEEKDRQRVSPQECASATRKHVLIIRTLDLVRLLDQTERGLITSNKVRELLLTESGWLKVTDERFEIVKA